MILQLSQGDDLIAVVVDGVAAFCAITGSVVGDSFLRTEYFGDAEVQHVLLAVGVVVSIGSPEGVLTVSIFPSIHKVLHGVNAFADTGGVHLGVTFIAGAGAAIHRSDHLIHLRLAVDDLRTARGSVVGGGDFTSYFVHNAGTDVGLHGDLVQLIEYRSAIGNIVVIILDDVLVFGLVIEVGVLINGIGSAVYRFPLTHSVHLSGLAVGSDGIGAANGIDTVQSPAYEFPVHQILGAANLDTHGGVGDSHADFRVGAVGVVVAGSFIIEAAQVVSVQTAPVDRIGFGGVGELHVYRFQLAGNAEQVVLQLGLHHFIGTGSGCGEGTGYRYAHHGFTANGDAFPIAVLHRGAFIGQIGVVKQIVHIVENSHDKVAVYFDTVGFTDEVAVCIVELDGLPRSQSGPEIGQKGIIVAVEGNLHPESSVLIGGGRNASGRQSSCIGNSGHRTSRCGCTGIGIGGGIVPVVIQQAATRKSHFFGDSFIGNQPVGSLSHIIAVEKQDGHHAANNAQQNNPADNHTDHIDFFPEKGFQFFHQWIPPCLGLV